MDEQENQSFVTGTITLSSLDMAIYLWKQYNSFSLPFKPKGATSANFELLSSDKYVSGEKIIEKYNLSKKDQKNMSLLEDDTYSVDEMSFNTVDINNNIVSSGEALVIYILPKKDFSIFVKEENGFKLKIRTYLKKKLFSSFPTDHITCY